MVLAKGSTLCNVKVSGNYRKFQSPQAETMATVIFIFLNEKADLAYALKSGENVFYVSDVKDWQLHLHIAKVSWAFC